MGVLKVFGVGENEAKRAKDRDTVRDLLRSASLKKYAAHDEEESCDGHPEDPGETVFSVARNKRQW